MNSKERLSKLMMITTYRKVYSIEVIFPLYLFCFDLSFSNVVVDEVHLHTFYNTTKNLAITKPNPLPQSVCLRLCQDRGRADHCYC